MIPVDRSGVYLAGDDATVRWDLVQEAVEQSEMCGRAQVVDGRHSLDPLRGGLGDPGECRTEPGVLAIEPVA